MTRTKTGFEPRTPGRTPGAKPTGQPCRAFHIKQQQHTNTYSTSTQGMGSNQNAHGSEKTKNGDTDAKILVAHRQNACTHETRVRNP